MKLLVLCDHDLPAYRALPEEPVDLVVGCGDLLDSALLQARDRYGVPLVAVKGNHDADAPFPAPIQDAHLARLRIGVLDFGGHRGAWRYKPRGHFLYDDEEVAAALEDYPRVDVFLAHNPPAGIHDRDDQVHRGFAAFRTYIEKRRPLAFIHGHVDLDRETRVGETRVIAAVGSKLVDL